MSQQFIEQWRQTGGSELANTQSFISGLCALLDVEPPLGSRSNDEFNDYVFERRVFQREADGTESFGRIDVYKRGCFVLEAKQGSDSDRAAVERGDVDFDLFGQTAQQRVKRGTARRGTPAWSRAMVEARGQAERYAKALPVEHGWPPFLLVVDVGYCIDVYADFSGTGKQYVQFPDAARYRIMLDDLADQSVRNRLKAIWTEPFSLDPSRTSARVTREIANTLAQLSKRLEDREPDPARVADFLMRCLFTMFAEDTGSKNEKLIPEKSFRKLLEKLRTRPENLRPALAELWARMDTGGFAGMLGEAGETLRRFNGYLFKDQTVLDLNSDEIGLLIEAASRNWEYVEPAIFGTLLERALDPKERAKLGAHYTPRAYVERLVAPTIIEPIREEWSAVQAAVAKLISENQDDQAKIEVERFHGRLARIRVLDPACGTGNFLYVAMARMKEIEGEVVSLLVELGDTQYVAELSGHTITPENFVGIETNPRAAAIAQLVLWIGYLQWHFRVNSDGRMPVEPVLRDVRTIECRDALLAWDDAPIAVCDEHGAPITRWDGTTTKLHPVTGKEIPDETARVPVLRYLNPRQAQWPRADYVIGNPPFIGGKDLRGRLGEGYVQALKSASKVPLSADFVMRWWDRAAELLANGSIRRFGLVTTNSITQNASRKVVAARLSAKRKISIGFAIPDHPWVDEKGSAAVRIAMTVGHKSGPGKLLRVHDESGAPDQITFVEVKGEINSSLEIGYGAESLKPLKANTGLSSRGCILVGDGFVLTAKELSDLEQLERKRIEIARPYRNGRDLTERPRYVSVLDTFGMTEAELRSTYPFVYDHLKTTVLPSRSAAVNDTADTKQYARDWWLFAKSRPEWRISSAGLRSYIATTQIAKHRIFQFLDIDILPDQRLVAISIDDPYILGVLSSRFHVVWSLRTGGTLEDRPIYNNSLCFDTFPFPNSDDTIKSKIRSSALELDRLRKDVLAAEQDLTLTKLYNALEDVKVAEASGSVISAEVRDIVLRGRVNRLLELHRMIDSDVSEAYDWETELSDDEIFERLALLNHERSRDEQKGNIHWLRPSFQSPSYVPPAAATLDLAVTEDALSTNLLSWPESLPEQLVAVSSILSVSPKPMHASDVARAFKSKRAATVEPILASLAAVGQARRLPDGRYAA